jgi:hypothetical protein
MGFAPICDIDRYRFLFDVKWFNPYVGSIINGWPPLASAHDPGRQLAPARFPKPDTGLLVVAKPENQITKFNLSNLNYAMVSLRRQDARLPMKVK